MIALLEKSLSVTESVFLAIANLLLAAMLVGGMINIVVREVFGQGIDWVFQLTTLFFAWSVFFGIFVVYRRNADVTISFLVVALGKRFEMINRYFVAAVTVFLLGTIALQAPTIIKLQTGLLEMLDLPRYVMAVPLFISCVLIMIDSVVALTRPLKPQPHADLT